MFSLYHWQLYGKKNRFDRCSWRDFSIWLSCFHIPGKFSAVRILMSLAGFVPIVNCYFWDRAQSPALTCIPPKHLNITQRRGIQNKRGSCAVVISWFREGKVGKTEKQHRPHNEKEWMQKQIYWNKSAWYFSTVVSCFSLTVSGHVR